MKRLRYLFLTGCIVCMAVIALFVGVGCNSSETSDDSGKQNEQVESLPNQTEDAEASVKIVSLPSQIDIGETLKVTVEYAPYVKGEKVELVSSDSDIVSIDEQGFLTANKIGTASLTAKYCGVEMTASIEVVKGDSQPSLLFNDGITWGSEGENYIGKNSSYTFSPYILFNNRVFNDAEIEYSIDKSEYATITNEGVLTVGNRSQTIVVTIKASWRGISSIELTRNVAFEIVSFGDFYQNNKYFKDILLYTKDNFEGATYSTTFDISGITAIGDGFDYSNTLSIEVPDETNKSFIDESEQVVIYDATAKTLTANAPGYATIKLSMQTDEGIISKSYKITCIRPVKKVEKVVELFSQQDADVQALVDEYEGFTITDVYQGGTDGINDATQGKILNVVDGKATNLSRSVLNEVSLETIVVYSKDCGYQFDLETYTKVIRTASDLASLYSTENPLVTGQGNSTNPIQGYFYVAEDIDATNYVLTPHDASYFAGVLDGNGHTIKYKLNCYGLLGNFGASGRTAEIKNVTLLAQGFNGGRNSWTKYALIANVCTGIAKLTNVYAKYDFDCEANIDIDAAHWGYTQGVGLFGNVSMSWGSIYTDVIVDMSRVTLQKNTTNYDYGVFGSISASNTCQTMQYKNVHVIWSNAYLAQKVNEDRNVSKAMLATNMSVPEGEATSVTTLYDETTTQGQYDITQYKSLDEMATAKERVGNFTISKETGITWSDTVASE